MPKLLSKFLGAGFVKVFSMVIGIIYTFLISNKFEIRVAGEIFTVIVIFHVISNFARFGFDSVIVRFLGESRYDASSIIKSSVVHVLSFSSLAGIISILTFFSLLPDFFEGATSKWIMPAVWLMTVFFVVIQTMACILQGFEYFRISLFVSGVAVNSLMSLGIYFGLFNDVYSFFWGLFYALMVTGSISVIFASKFSMSKMREIPVKSKVTSKELLMTAWPLFLIILASQTVTWGGQLTASTFLSSEEVALFNVAFRIAAGLGVFLLVVNFVVAPKFAFYFQAKNFREMRFLAVTSTRWISIISMPIALGGFYWSHELMGVFGSNYSQAGSVLCILIAGQLVQVCTGPVGILLNMTGHEKVTKKIMLRVWSVGLLMLVGGASYQGLFGLAVGWSLAISMQNLIGVLAVRRLLGFNILSWGTECGR